MPIHRHVLSSPVSCRGEPIIRKEASSITRIDSHVKLHPFSICCHYGSAKLSASRTQLQCEEQTQHIASFVFMPGKATAKLTVSLATDYWLHTP